MSLRFVHLLRVIHQLVVYTVLALHLLVVRQEQFAEVKQKLVAMQEKAITPLTFLAQVLPLLINQTDAETQTVTD